MKKSIFLVGMGGVRRLADIPVFLFNMFNDKNIIPKKQPLRAMLAFAITIMRAKGTYSIYKKVKSPVFDITIKQSKKLKQAVGVDVICKFGYSKPFLDKEAFFCVPLYGFYSHTTHGLVFEKCHKIFPPLCIFGEFMDLMENRILKSLKNIPHKYKDVSAVVLSAHSLPVRLAKKTNDPYKKDLEVFAEYIKKRIKIPVFLSFQSKLGPIEWFKPSTEDIIKKLSSEYKSIIIVPVSFVQDNTETVYEIDIVYKKLARECGIEYFDRVECLNDDDEFIKFLSEYLKKEHK